jgi:hypothetical protein
VYQIRYADLNQDFTIFLLFQICKLFSAFLAIISDLALFALVLFLVQQVPANNNGKQKRMLLSESEEEMSRSSEWGGTVDNREGEQISCWFRVGILVIQL